MLDINIEKCPKCAGRLSTSIEYNKRICPFCGAEFALDNCDGIQEVEFRRLSINDDVPKQESINMETKVCYDREELCKSFLSQIGNEVGKFKTTDKLRKGLRIPATEKVYLGHDDTFFKNGKNGFAIAESGIYCCILMEKMHYVSYSELSKCHSLTWQDKKKDVILADDIALTYCVLLDDDLSNQLMLLLEKIVESTKEYQTEIPVTSNKLIENPVVNNKLTEMDVNAQRCPNCAGKLVTDFQTMKKECPFCGAVFCITEGKNVNDDSSFNVISEQSVKRNSYNVKLVEIGPNKVKAIKALREFTGLGLKEAKDLLDFPSSILLKGATKEEVDSFIEKMVREAPGIVMEVV